MIDAPALAAPKNHPLLHGVLLAALLLLTATVYASLASADFITLDDPRYTQFDRIKSGLTPSNVLWAFTHPHGGFFIPLTWVSLQLDWTLFSGNPGAMHIHNLALHLINIVFVYFILLKIFKRPLPAIAGAVLWALHPLRVESVAWITERKDVLSGFFGFPAILVYLHYIQTKPSRAIWLAALLMGLATLAKPMFVTLPLLLLLLDYWPLARTEPFLKRAIEKWPLFVITGVGSLLTTFAHIRNNTNLDFPLSLRLSNATISYFRYLWKTVDLEHLGLLYPLPASWPLPLVLASLTTLMGITAILFFLRKRVRWPLIGWLFFVIAFLPMIGLVQAWVQALADRFTYLPYLGLSLLLAGGITFLDTPKLRPVAIALILALAAALSFYTYRQNQYWKDPITLYRHSLSVERSPELHDLLGSRLWESANKTQPPERDALLDQSESEYKKAMELAPTNSAIKKHAEDLRAYRARLR